MMDIFEFDPDFTERIPFDPAERVAYELWSMQANDDRAWADHLRRLADYHNNFGKRIDCYAYRPRTWPPA